MNNKTILLLAIALLTWVAPVSGQTPQGAKNCQFYHLQQTSLAQCIEEGDTSYEKNSLKIMWPIIINDKKCDNLQQELIKCLTGRDDIHQFDQAVNYYLYTNAEGEPIDVESKCSFIDNSSVVDGWKTTTASSLIELQSLFERFVTFHMFDYIYFAGAAHGLESNTYLTYDLVLDKVVTFEDIISDPEALRPAILQSIKDTYNNSIEFLNLDEDGLPPLATCFYFDNGALHIVYQPYEITGYAQGTIDVPIYPYMLGDKEDPEAFTPYGLEVLNCTRFGY